MTAETEIPELDAGIEAWTTQLIRVGVLVMFIFEAASLALSPSIAGSMTAGVLLPHIAAITVTVLFYLFTWAESFQTRWRQSIFVLAATIVATSSAFSVSTNQNVTFVISMVLLLLGTAALVPWGTRWQAALTLVCACAVAANAMQVSASDAYGAYRWLELATAAALAQFIALIAEHYRGEMRARLTTLKENEAKLWKIFETNPDGVMITRLADGRFISVSDEFLKTGFSREEVLHGSERELGVWADEAQYLAYHAQLKTQGYARNVEALIRRKDRTTRPCMVSGVVIELSHGPSVVSLVRGLSGIRGTETELVAAREAALAASRAKSEFLSAMSHEIRTPMNAILGMADLLSETALSNEQRKYLSIMMNNGAALLDLIDDILDFARVESGKLALETEDFDLCDLAERVAETLSIRAHQKQLEIAVRIAPGVPTALVGDPLRLRQILINLLGNAIKFTDSGEVVLTVERDASESDPGRLHFIVSDTGIGLAENQREHVFASYTQADISTARKYGGTGLGLAIVKQLVELMGGRIWVESELGSGSTFHFTACFSVQRPAVASGTAESAADLRGLRVLVVDDTAVNRLALTETLSARGAIVTDAAAIEQALAEIERARASSLGFDVILLDCRMPQIDSDQIVRRMVATAHEGTVVPMLTSDDLNIRLPLLRTMGLPHYLIKPVRHAELLEVITTVIRPNASIMANVTEPATIGIKTAGAEPSAPAAPTPRDVAADSSERPLRILVADDSADNRVLIEAFLKRAACMLDEAENGQVALQKFISGKYDVVLMDIQMPVMDGYTATRRIREWERDH
ncbi:MAG: ATP-binding protein, partial [Candidatus Binataceae bacterium]